MRKIKAIETEYNGYKFRSRLEARWAVFFDAAGIEYEYEPQGFEMEDGTRYLPDFYLPELKVFVEVKGVMDEYDEHKIEAFVKALSDEYRGLYVVGDIPNLNSKHFGFEKYLIFYQKTVDGEVWGDQPYRFCICPVCGKYGLEFEGRGYRVDGCLPDSRKRLYFPEAKRLDHDDKGYSYMYPIFVKAYDKARQARFEHGEQPTI